MKKIMVLVCVTLILALSGCASFPSAQELATANYGSPLAQDKGEEQIKNS